MKPDDSRRAFAGRQISVDVERWGETEREVVRLPGAVAIVGVDREHSVRIPVAELEARLGEVEDAKTLSGLLLYLRGR